MALMIVDSIEIDSTDTLKEVADYMRYVPMDLYLDGCLYKFDGTFTDLDWLDNKPNVVLAEIAAKDDMEIFSEETPVSSICIKLQQKYVLEFEDGGVYTIKLKIRDCNKSHSFRHLRWLLIFKILNLYIY